ncbi:hypothetical protein [Burkholderia cepacia]|uniref:hypothetical protein n=1 Tax=Burkholderia cepacia TaxID=292 RepID=UPI003527D667
MMKRPFPERMEILEALVADTGLADELTTKKRAKEDARRADLARELKALPNPERELATLSKEATQAEANFIKAQAAYRDAEKAMVETRTRVVITAQMHDGNRQRILTELERSAPRALTEALDDLSFADDLLRAAVRVEVLSSRNWLGVQVTAVDSNMDGITTAREAISEAKRDVRSLMHESAPYEELVAKAAAIVDAVTELAYPFIGRERWERRHSRPHGDMLTEVAGYKN